MTGFIGPTTPQNDPTRERSGQFDKGGTSGDYLAPGSLYVTMELENANGELEPFEILGNYFVRLRETVLSDAAGILTMEMFDPDWDFVENAVILSMDKVHIQYGWQSEDESKLMPKRKFTLTKLKPSFDYQGNYIIMEFVERGNTDLMRDKTTRSGPSWIGEVTLQTFVDKNGDTSTFRISDFVIKIAERYGLEPDVEQSTELFTSDILSLYQLNESPIGFIIRMAQFAVSEETKASGYKALVTNNKLIFKTSTNEIKRRYLYARDAESPIISFNPNVFENVYLNSSYARTTHVGHSPLDKEIILSESDSDTLRQSETSKSEVRPEGPDVTSDNNNELVENPNRFSRTKPDEIRYNSKILKPIETNSDNFKGSLFITPYATSQLIQDINKAKYKQASNLQIQCEIEIIGDPELFPLDLVEVNVLNNKGEYHFTSGVYTLIEVEHTIDENGFITKLITTGDSFGVPSENEYERSVVENTVAANAANIKKDFETFYGEKSRKEPGSSGPDLFGPPAPTGNGNTPDVRLR